MALIYRVFPRCHKGQCKSHHDNLPACSLVFLFCFFIVLLHLPPRYSQSNMDFNMGHINRRSWMTLIKEGNTGRWLARLWQDGASSWSQGSMPACTTVNFPCRAGATKEKHTIWQTSILIQHRNLCIPKMHANIQHLWEQRLKAPESGSWFWWVDTD